MLNYLLCENISAEPKIAKFIENNQEELVLVEAKNLKKKKELFKTFAKNYRNVIPSNPAFYADNRKYLVAYINGTEVGFIVISDKSSFFENESVWCAAEAYVHPKFRSRGYLRQMIQLVIRDHFVRMAYIENSRFWSNFEYYTSLGFSAPRSNNELVFVRLKTHEASSKPKPRH